ncbi:MAG TPA: ABC transporter permease [Pseudolabrys sp.]|nr:ABC transporter permease [Pseudolabrys sp.]
MSQLDLRANPIAWRSVVSVLLFVALWEIAARSHAAPAILLPPFSVVAEQLWRSTLDGTLISDLSLSLGRAICGLFVATVGGVILGLLMARNRAVEWLADPLVALGFPSPKIAFLPIFILWFGIESLSKILLVAFACIFPVIIGTYSAARAVSRLFVWSAVSLGSGRSSVFLHVILPACYPRIFTTFRIAVPVGLITTFTAEMVAGGGGMGGTLIYSQRFFESPTVFAYIVVMLAIGLVFDAAMRRFQHRFLRWAEE